MQVLFSNNHNNAVQRTGISHIWGFHYSCHLPDTTKLPTNGSPEQMATVQKQIVQQPSSPQQKLPGQPEAAWKINSI